MGISTCMWSAGIIYRSIFCDAPFHKCINCGYRVRQSKPAFQSNITVSDARGTCFQLWDIELKKLRRQMKKHEAIENIFLQNCLDKVTKSTQWKLQEICFYIQAFSTMKVVTYEAITPYLALNCRFDIMPEWTYNHSLHGKLKLIEPTLVKCNHIPYVMTSISQ